MPQNPHKKLHMVVQEKEVAPEDLTLFVEANETPRYFDLPAYYTTLANHAIIIGTSFLLSAGSIYSKFVTSTILLYTSYHALLQR